MIIIFVVVVVVVVVVFLSDLKKIFLSDTVVYIQLDDNAFTWCSIMQQCTITIHPFVKYTYSRALSIMCRR